MLPLKTYIECTRKIKGARSSELNDYYHKIFKRIKKHAQFDIGRVELEVIYSTNKTAEMLQLNGQYFLVYDQYLGQVFNMMNRLFFNSTEPRESLGYSFKIFAEEIQLEGRADAGLIFAISHIKLMEESATYKKDRDLAKRTTYTAIQEMFIMIHELVHFSKMADQNYIARTRTEALELLDDMLTKFDNPELQDDTTLSYLADEYKLLYGDQPYSKDMLPEGYFEKLRDEHIAMEKKSMNVIRQMVEMSDQLIEEMICDEQAAMLTMYIMHREYKTHPEDSFDGVYLAMLHLRTIGILNTEAKHFNSNYKEDQTELSQFLLTSDLRTRKLRDELTNLNGVVSKDETKKETMHRKMIDTNERYHEILLDPVLFMSLPKIARVKTEMVGKDLDFNQLMKASDNIDFVLASALPSTSF